MAYQMNMGAFSVAGAATVFLGSVAGGMLNYGTYGYLRDKGWSTWKSGAAVGAISGGLAALAMLALPALMPASYATGDLAGLPTFGATSTHARFARAALPLLHVR
jgi:hypothetical protein